MENESEKQNEPQELAPETANPASTPSEPVQEQAPEATPPAQPPQEDPKGKGKRGQRKSQGRARPAPVGDPEFIEKVISINRVTKVTKGGKKLSFSALVVVGNGKGKVGYYLGKANEVATAIRKALTTAKKNMVQIPLKGSTITHQINGECGGAVVLLKPASEGTGVIASGPVRAVCDAAGIHNILTKCHRSNNPINVVKATVNGLVNLKPIEREEVNVSEETHAAA